MPRTLISTSPADSTDDLDVWSSFAGKAPVWSDDQPVDPHDETGEMERVAPVEPVVDEVDDVTNRDDSIPLRREPGRITIGTDPTDDRSRPVPRKGRPGEPTRGGRPARSGSPSIAAVPADEVERSRPADRDRRRPRHRGRVHHRRGDQSEARAGRRGRCARLGAVEYFDKVSEKGYRPATIIGIIACVTCRSPPTGPASRPCR